MTGVWILVRCCHADGAVRKVATPQAWERRESGYPPWVCTSCSTLARMQICAKDQGKQACHSRSLDDKGVSDSWWQPEKGPMGAKGRSSSALCPAFRESLV